MVRSQQRSQDKLIAFLRSLAYEQGDVLFVPSVGWIRDRIPRTDFYTIDGALDYLDTMGKIAVIRSPERFLWIDMKPANAY